MTGAGDRIKRLREKEGLTQLQLAEKLSMNNSVLSRIEAGKRPIEDTELRMFADYFGVKADYLLGRSDELIAKEQKVPYYALTEKDEKDIAKRLESVMDSLESSDSLAFHGDDMDEETRELLKMALEHGMRIATETAKRKYTPKKYRK